MSSEDVDDDLLTLINIPKQISNLRNLTSLNVNGNNLRTLPESIGLLKNLESIEVACNDLKKLPNSFTKLEELIYIDSSKNPNLLI